MSNVESRVSKFSQRLKEIGLTPEQCIAVLEASIEYSNSIYDEHIDTLMGRQGGE